MLGTSRMHLSLGMRLVLHAHLGLGVHAYSQHARLSKCSRTHVVQGALFRRYQLVLLSACVGRSARGASLYQPFKCTFGDECTDSWRTYLDVRAWLI